MCCRSIRNPGKQSSFLLDLWRSPSTQACIDDAVGGYKLVPTMDHECSHANLQVRLHYPLVAVGGSVRQVPKLLTLLYEDQYLWKS